MYDGNVVICDNDRYSAYFQADDDFMQSLKNIYKLFNNNYDGNYEINIMDLDYYNSGFTSSFTIADYGAIAYMLYYEEDIQMAEVFSTDEYIADNWFYSIETYV